MFSTYYNCKKTPWVWFLLRWNGISEGVREVQGQTAITAYLISKRLLLFVFACGPLHSSTHHKALLLSFQHALKTENPIWKLRQIADHIAGGCCILIRSRIVSSWIMWHSNQLVNSFPYLELCAGGRVAKVRGRAIFTAACPACRARPNRSPSPAPPVPGYMLITALAHPLRLADNEKKHSQLPLHIFCQRQRLKTP